MQASRDAPWSFIELDYWASRSGDLGMVASQLSSDRVQLVAAALKAAGSSYAAPLLRIMEEVEAARDEAKDNARMLAPLRKPLERFSGFDDFPALPDTFQVLCRLWLWHTHMT